MKTVSALMTEKQH